MSNVLLQGPSSSQPKRSSWSDQSATAVQSRRRNRGQCSFIFFYARMHWGTFIVWLARLTFLCICVRMSKGSPKETDAFLSAASFLAKLASDVTSFSMVKFFLRKQTYFCADQQKKKRYSSSRYYLKYPNKFSLKEKKNIKSRNSSDQFKLYQKNKLNKNGIFWDTS